MPLSLEEADRMLAEPAAFELLAPYLSPAAADADSASANAVLLKLAGQRRRDGRWRAVLLALLENKALRPSVIYAIGTDPSAEIGDAYAALLATGRAPELAVPLGARGDPRALPHLLELLDAGCPGTTPWALFRGLDPVVGPSAVGPLTRWLAAQPSHVEARNAKALLRKAKALAAGKAPPTPKAPDFSGFVPKLVAEGKRAVAAFRKAHPGAHVCAFAFDADPHEQFFAGCFDDATRDGAIGETQVGDYRWHLFHEFELPVSSKLPRGPLPASPDLKDGYTEHHFRPVIAEACRQLAASGALDALKARSPVTVGYCFHGEPLVVCATVGGAPA